MKRLVNILLVLSLTIICSPSLFGQLSGSGTYADPYSGTLNEGTGNEDVTWSSDTYIDGDITVDNEKLTISAGVNIIFLAEGSDLIITGTGQLDATGTSGSIITFTADDDDDGIYGESGERWGHIVFQSMDGSAGSSVFEYCNISYGDVISGSNTTSYGGAFYIDSFDNLTLSYCQINNNTGTHGGAVMLWNGASPTFEYCTFSNNSAQTSGGGFYINRANTSTFSNSLIFNNSCGLGGGGAIFFDGTVDSDIINCVIVNNSTTSTTRGDNLRFYSLGASVRPSFVNSIIWGSNNSISYSDLGDEDSSDFYYCGIQDTETPASSFTNCIDLNSSNTASDGPNFNATDGSDWSISFVSPCRDIGTDTGAPATDFDGNSRIGTTDIGAYEVQYSRWSGSVGTLWTIAGNWEQNMTPTSGSSDVIIPSGLTYYPVSSGISYTIGTGKSLILEEGTRATFVTLTNSAGFLELHSDNTGIASLLVDSYIDSGGTEMIELYLSGGGGPNYKWHYIAVPEDAISTDVFTTDISNKNLLLWDDSKIVDNKMQGWQWFDGYDGTTAFSFMNTIKGYNFFHYSDITIQLPTVSGLLVSMGSSVGLQYNGDGLNLLGNSLTCSLDWHDVERSHPASIDAAVYYTINNMTASYHPVTGGVNGGTRYIPPLQGFFVKTSTTGTSLDFTQNNVKTHSDQNRYKGGTIVPKVKLKLSGSSGGYECIIWFDEYATTGHDSEYDAQTMFDEALNYNQIWSAIEGNKFAINGLPFPEEEMLIPITIKVIEEGSFIINSLEFQGLENYYVELIDSYQNFTTDFHSEDTYSFTSSPGTFEDRFQLKVSSKTTGLDDIIDAGKLINIYSFNNNLYIRPNNDNWSDPETNIKIYDMMGRLVSNINNVSIYGGETKEIPFIQPEGIYIVELSGKTGRVVQKISKR